MNKGQVSPSLTSSFNAQHLRRKNDGPGWVGMGSGRLGIGIGFQKTVMRAFGDWEGLGLGGNGGGSER